MSKEAYSNSIYQTMLNKMRTLEYKHTNYFFQYDEIFELVLCLAYMTLSKEKIIDKEIKNQDRLGRLTKHVSTIDIDAMFDPSFNTEIPIINNSLESDNLWILDTIRDSIMHGAFDIDMTKKCFILNNTKSDRLLNAEIPFSWFVAYTKNDIFRKKILDKYTVRGFFYNDFKKHYTNVSTERALNDHILYEVVIKGDKFKVDTVETRVKELFHKYRNTRLPQEVLAEYLNKLPRTRNEYDLIYLATFAAVSDKVKEDLKKEFPDLDVRIFVKDKKRKITKRLIRKMDDKYLSYESYIDAANNFISPNGTTELKYIANIIQNLINVPEEEIKLLKEPEAIFLFNKLIEDKDNAYRSYNDVRKRYQYNLEQARLICMTSLAISTLVINQDSIYNTYYDGHNPADYNFVARTRQPLEHNLSEERRIRKQMLEKQILLAELEEQLSGCPDPKGKQNITNNINGVKKQIEGFDEDLTILIDQRYAHKEYTRNASVENTKRDVETVNKRLSQRLNSFDETKDIEAKKRIAEIIDLIYEDYIETESKDAFWAADDMKVALTIIRNCFSHLDRIYIGSDRKAHTTIILSDYENDGTKSGEVIISYEKLTNLLLQPLISGPTLKKTP